jgi:hypothetical protein
MAKALNYARPQFRRSPAPKWYENQRLDVQISKESLNSIMNEYDEFVRLLCETRASLHGTKPQHIKAILDACLRHRYARRAK